MKYLLMAVCVLMVLYILNTDGWEANSDKSLVLFLARGPFEGLPEIKAVVKFDEIELKDSSFKVSVPLSCDESK